MFNDYKSQAPDYPVDLAFTIADSHRLVTNQDNYITSLSQRPTQVIAQAQAAATATTTATLSVEAPKPQEALGDLREEADTPALERAQDLVDKISPDADKEKVIESGVMSKLKRLVERGLDDKTKFGKTVKAAESGIMNLQKVG